MYVYEFPNYFNIVPGIINNGIEWLCKNFFKHKYFELLEEYKMELMQMYIQKGYPYDVLLPRFGSKMLRTEKYLWKYL